MNAPPSRQAARSQAARSQIVQAALRVFGLKGYSAASMDDVRMAAGISKGGLYHHFSTKSAVLAGVVDRLAAERALLLSLSHSGTPLPARTIGRVLIDVWAEAARNQSLRARLHAGYQACINEILEAPEDRGLAEILRIGAVVQLLTRSEPPDAPDAEEAAHKLNIDRVA